MPTSQIPKARATVENFAFFVFLKIGYFRFLKCCTVGLSGDEEVKIDAWSVQWPFRYIFKMSQKDHKVFVLLGTHPKWHLILEIDQQSRAKVYIPLLCKSFGSFIEYVDFWSLLCPQLENVLVFLLRDFHCRASDAFWVVNLCQLKRPELRACCRAEKLVSITRTSSLDLKY